MGILKPIHLRAFIKSGKVKIRYLLHIREDRLKCSSNFANLKIVDFSDTIKSALEKFMDRLTTLKSANWIPVRI